ncbi:hypothetical protein [Candidatus Mesenet endosymbiont of Phosphuga atrata]
MCKELRDFGLPVICVDARGIAQMMRIGLYREVLVKSDKSCQINLEAEDS